MAVASTGVQVTLWQLSREKSLIAKRSEMKGNSGHTSKADFGSDICASRPSQPVLSPLCDFWLCGNCRHSRHRHGATPQRPRLLRSGHHAAALPAAPDPRKDGPQSVLGPDGGAVDPGNRFGGATYDPGRTSATSNHDVPAKVRGIGITLAAVGLGLG